MDNPSWQSAVGNRRLAVGSQPSERSEAASRETGRDDGASQANTNNSLFLLALAAVAPLVQLVALAVSSPAYSYFIDEFYYIACSKHLAFGYVDHPPLAPALLAFTRIFLGDSLLGIRLLPFLAAGATAWLVGRLTEELGGRRFAIATASLSVALAPGMLAMTGFFSMNAFEPLLWTALMLALVRIVRTGNSRLWLVVGALAGLAFENKHTIIAYVAALAAGLVLCRTRRMLRDPWLWAGAAIAIAVALPNVLWQVVNGWPSLEFYRNAQFMKNVPSPPLRSLTALALIMNPVVLPLSLTGLAALLFGRRFRDLRFLGVMFLVLVVMHVASKTSRPDRMIAAYPIVIAAGAVIFERFVRRSAWRGLLFGAVIASDAALGLLWIPVLPPPQEAQYTAWLGLNIQAERGKTSPIPQLLADRTGWESFIDDIDRVYRSLPPDDQKRAVVYLPDYGHAGALELMGPARGLPRVIASQNSYWHWSDGHVNTPVLIAVDAGEKELRMLYRDVREVGRVRCEYCMSWRSDMSIRVAKDPIAPVQSLWHLARHYE